MKLRYEQTEQGTTLLRLSVSTAQGDGQVAVPWESAFQGDHVVFLVQPNGTAMAVSAKKIKARSSRQERKRIEAIGGRRHSGSGSKAGLKSDGSVGYRWRMENKFTMADSYRVTLSDLHKLRSECINGQAPLFNIDFQDKRTGVTRESWVLMPSAELERLINASKNE